MSTTLTQKMGTLSKARRARIAARTVELEAEEMSLQALRQARKLTQERMAKVLGVAQESVSRLENRKDVLLSTLQHYVKAMGGQLRVTVDFPDRPSVRIVDLPPKTTNVTVLRERKAGSTRLHRKRSARLV